MRNLLFLGLIFVAACQTQKQTAPQDPAARAEEVEVLVTLLKAQFPSFTNSTPVLVVEDKFSVERLVWSRSYRDFSRDLIAKAQESEKAPDYLREFTYVPADAVRDFCEKNQSREAVWPELEARLPIRLLGKRESWEFFKHQEGEKPDGWDRFYAAYPGSPGIITISRVGFNQQRNMAIVYLGCQGGWLGGDGSLTVFGKKNGRWERLPVFFGPMWVS